MKTYKLFVIASGSRISKSADATAKGIVEAEKKADELLEQYINDYPSDTYVACVEDELDMNCIDYLCWQQDCYGERYWMMMEYGYYCPIGLRSLTDVEEEYIDLLRDEKEKHITDLDEEQLKKLRSEIIVGSSYYADYRNSFEIDEKEVCNYADGYESYISNEELEDTPKEFADFILCMAV